MTSLAEAPAIVANGGDLQPEPFRISVSLYEEMVRAGQIGADDKLELIRGVIVRKMPTNAPHTYATFELAALLLSLVGNRWAVRSQGPVVIPDESMPEPDVSIAVGARKDYATVKPVASQIVLAVEVSETSLAFDLGVKLALYAAAKIPEYWVVDLEGRRVHVHTLPRSGKKPGYRKVSVVDAAGVVPLTLRGESFGTVAVKEFLP